MTLTLILAILISGCKKNDYQATVGVCPVVISTDPDNGEAGVPLSQVVSATFNEKMNAATITSTTFTVIDATKSAELKAAVVITGTLSYSGMTSSFTPSSPLAPNTTYTGRMTTAARDLMGNALQADKVWTFKTDLPPTVTSDPPDLATGVPLNKVIVATFSVPVDSLTLKSSATNFTIKQGTTTVPGNFSYTSDGKTASFTPTSNLAPFTVYNGTIIAAGVKNKFGTLMAADYPWSFTTIPQLTLSSLPALGGTTSGGGTFAVGSSVTVIATANAGFTFVNWTDGVTVESTSATYQLTMPARNKTLVANYTAIPYIVSVSSKPLLGGTTTGGGTYNSGASVTVTAIANPGFTFTNWTEGVNVVSSTSSYQFVIAGNRTLVANYTAIPYTVTVSSLPVLGGVTTGGGIFNSGASVTVAASANTGFTFTNWTEGTNIVSTSANYQFTIAGNRTLVANYNAIPYTVEVSSNPLLGGTTTGGGTFNSGSLVTVKAVPNVGYTFTNWKEGLVVASTNANYQFTITGNRILVANYTPITYTLAVSSNPSAGGITTGGGTFNSGASVAVHAVANDGYIFTNWTEIGTTLSITTTDYTFTLSGNRTLVANYTARYTVTASTNPSTLSNQPTGGGTFNSGASVTVTAAANSGYNFTNWTEGVNGVSDISSYQFNIAGPRILVANYTAISPAGPLAIDLGCAAPFVILAGSTISNTGPSIITGDVGLSPGSALIGFPPATIIDGTAQITTPIADAAKLCLTAAFIDGQGRSLNAISLPGQLGGLTLAPGLYSNSSTSGISGTGSNGILTLDAQGNADAVWIFQMGSTLTTDPATSIVLAGNAQAKNIFWIVGSSATLGTTSIFKGNILADQSITLKTGAVLEGRALTRIAAVTLDDNAVTKPQ